MKPNPASCTWCVKCPQDTVYYNTAIVSVVTVCGLSYLINSTQEIYFTDNI